MRCSTDACDAIKFLLGYVTMWIYDYALTKMITFYLIRLRPRIGLKWK